MQLPVQRLDESTIPVSPWIALPFHLPHQAAHNREVFIETPSASKWCLSRSKRLLDISIALLVLAILAIPLLVIAVCVRWSSRGPALFVQNRVGRGGRLFAIYKFRSMTFDSGSGPRITKSGDQRITALGHWLRRFKIDELPQFYNILRGDMSLVGPRPKLPSHEAISNMPYCPGITGAATLAFRREEEILKGIHASQLDAFYANEVTPLKARMDLQYMSQATFWSDMQLIGKTFLACVLPAPLPTPFQADPEQRDSKSMVA